MSNRDHTLGAWIFAALALVSVYAVDAWAAHGLSQPVNQIAVVSGYREIPDNHDHTLYRTDLNGGELFTDIGSCTATSGDSSIAVVETISCSGSQNVSVEAHTSVASATVVLTAVCYAWDSTTLKAGPTVTWTATGGATYTITSDYPSGARSIDTRGYPIMKVFAADPSSGTASLSVKVY